MLKLTFPSVSVRVLKRNRTNSMYIYTEIYLKELAYAIVRTDKLKICRAGKSKIYRAGWLAGNSSRSRRRNLEVEFPLENSVFVLKNFQTIDKAHPHY